MAKFQKHVEDQTMGRADVVLRGQTIGLEEKFVDWSDKRVALFNCVLKRDIEVDKLLLFDCQVDSDVKISCDTLVHFSSCAQNGSMNNCRVTGVCHQFFFGYLPERLCYTNCTMGELSVPSSISLELVGCNISKVIRT